MSNMAGIFKEEEQGVGQSLNRVMIDEHGAVLRFSDSNGVGITVFLEPRELDKVIEEQNRYLISRAKERK